MILIKERIGKLLEDIQKLIYTDTVPIKHYKLLQSKEGFDDINGICTDTWVKLTNKELWGGDREYFWFETIVIIPQELDGKCIAYELKTGREGEWDATNPQFSVYINGVRKQGLDVNHREVLLTEKAKAGDTYRIILSAFTGDDNFKLIMDSCIKVLHRTTEKYFYDISVPYQAARLLPDTSHAYITIITALNESLNLLDLRKEHSEAYEQSLEMAQEYITEKFYDKCCGESTEAIYCVGHTHIDLAWLWTLAVTEDKVVRSFSTVLELMKQYPEYVFMSSQPQLYQYVKEKAPDVYEEIKERIQEGRWETEGGMFVEADCNLSSGESLVRQFVHGKRFFKEEFGKDNEILWLPDVFGYSAALPQIMKKCGIKYFMTTKISWNEFNKMPYDTFEWEGIDGTKILTHFSPSRDYNKGAVEGGTETEHFTTYNAYINPSQVKGAWERYSQKHLNGEVLMSFGYGDGGGGPTKDMLENQRRLSKGIPGCPKTIMSNSRNFFHLLEKHVKNHKYLPVWVGELYLEYHRGTYTSIARNKKYNRKAEFLLQNTELFSLIDRELTNAAYPKKDIQDLWEIVLRNQFHDILPGSSIKEVYEDSKAEYEKVLQEGGLLSDNALQTVAEGIDAPKDSLVVFNPNSTKGEGIVTFACPQMIANPVIIDEGGRYPVQKIEEGKFIFTALQVPSKGYRTYTVMQDEVPERAAEETSLNCSDKHIENRFVRVEFNSQGQISSIYDRLKKREILMEGSCANVLMTYEDRPHNYDAWDVNNYYTEKSWEITDLEEMSIVEAGAVRCTMKIKRKYLDSEITQYVSLGADSAEITVKNEIDWKEKNIFMKALVPVDIHTDEARFEIQYGNVTRKTHYNTSWDFARFEVCMHKWLDVSEDGYGVSILNDCKYGVSVHDGVVGISLLKSAVYPNPDADKEHHSFTFSIYPHKGDFKKAETIDKAYALNNPMQAVIKKIAGGTLPTVYSCVSVDVPNAIIEVVKEAEGGKEIIVRLYEAFNRRTQVKMNFHVNIANIVECNMLEEVENAIEYKEMEACFTLKPYEIKTFKVSF